MILRCYVSSSKVAHMNHTRQGGKELGVWAWDLVLASFLTGCVTLGKRFNLSFRFLIYKTVCKIIM